MRNIICNYRTFGNYISRKFPHTHSGTFIYSFELFSNHIKCVLHSKIGEILSYTLVFSNLNRNI